jgi:hypothetical protein
MQQIPKHVTFDTDAVHVKKQVVFVCKNKTNLAEELRYFPGICLEGIIKTTDNLKPDARSPSRDLNLGLPEYEVRTIAMLLLLLAQSAMIKWHDVHTMFNEIHQSVQKYIWVANTDGLTDGLYETSSLLSFINN